MAGGIIFNRWGESIMQESLETYLLRNGNNLSFLFPIVFPQIYIPPTQPAMRSEYTVYVPHYEPKLAPVFKRFEAISNLPQNWDSYGSEPPSKTALDAARKILLYFFNARGEQSIPYNIVPLSGGGIQMEWKNKDKAIEIEVEIGPNLAFSYLQISSPGANREFEEKDDVSEYEIRQLIDNVVR